MNIPPDKKSEIEVYRVDLSALLKHDYSTENVLQIIETTTRNFGVINPLELITLLTSRNESEQSLKYDFTANQLSQMETYMRRGKRKMKEAGCPEGFRDYSAAENHVSRALWIKKNAKGMYGTQF